MADHRFLDSTGNVLKTFATEDGKNYRHYRQDMDPIIKRVDKIRRQQNESGRSDWYHAGSIPQTLLLDWLNKHGYEWRDFMTNAGGDPRHFARNGPGVRDKFLTYFYSRDFSKLHNQHVTTKRSDSGFHFTGGD